MTPESEALLKEIHEALVGNVLKEKKGLLERMTIAEKKIWYLMLGGSSVLGVDKIIHLFTS